MAAERRDAMRAVKRFRRETPRSRGASLHGFVALRYQSRRVISAVEDASDVLQQLNARRALDVRVQPAVTPEHRWIAPTFS
jgi:hypothetical protein